MNTNLLSIIAITTNLKKYNFTNRVIAIWKTEAFKSLLLFARCDVTWSRGALINMRPVVCPLLVQDSSSLVNYVLNYLNYVWNKFILYCNYHYWLARVSSDMACSLCVITGQLVDCQLRQFYSQSRLDMNGQLIVLLPKVYSIIMNLCLLHAKFAMMIIEN